MPTLSPRRRTAVLLLVGIGTFAVLTAILLPGFVYPRMARLPADPQQSQVQTARGATVLLPDLGSPTGVRIAHGAAVRITTFVSEPRFETFGDSVVWNLATRVEVDGKLLNARVERVSQDPHTGRPTNCCGDSLTTEQDGAPTPLVHVGYVGFPFDTQPHDYAMWDVTLRRTRTAVYRGTETRRGVRVYRFVIHNDALPTGTQDLPGALFGSHAPSVRATAEYTDTRTFWVEPNSGGPVDMRDVIDQEFRSGARSLPAMSATLVAQPLTDRQLAQLRQGARVLPWIRGRAAWVLLPLAAVLFALATLLARSPRRWAASREPVAEHEDDAAGELVA